MAPVALTTFTARWAAAALLVLGCSRPSALAPSSAQPDVRAAQRAPHLEARLQDCRPLLYAEAGTPDLDRPQFVRSASGMERFGNGFAILQDDLNSVGMVLASGEAHQLDLPRDGSEPHRFEHARGNLHLKTDYEAAFVLERDDAQLLFAFGSGTLPPRERIAIVNTTGSARRVDAGAFYAALRAAEGFSGGSLNLEAAEVRGEWLLLLQRGNPERGVENAIAGMLLSEFLAWTDGRGSVPAVRWVERYDLGADSGVGFGFSGLSAARDGRLVFTASAERGHSPHGDGRILGSRLGLLDADAAWWAPIVHHDGRAAPLKVEGVVSDRDDPRRYLLTTDPDDPDEPALLCTAELSGDWPRPSNNPSLRTEPP